MGNDNHSRPVGNTNTSSSHVTHSQPSNISHSTSSNTNNQIPRSSPEDTPPGAYSIQGNPSGRGGPQQFYVTIPAGVQPGQHFAVLVNGQQMMVRCPPGNRENDRLIVTVPRQQSQQYVVTVPPNVRPGEQFRVLINTQEVMVTCPRGVRPGQRVTFQLPEQDRSNPAQQQQPAPNHQMFEVTVPEGVRPGQPFALIANGQRVMVTCPPNVRPGQKIRFQLPVQLSQQQLEAIRVNYDKDGWMRCLGQDLKFHWVYNKSDSSTNKEKDLMSAKNSTNKKVIADLDADAVVRILKVVGTNVELGLIRATEYAIETSVKGTSVNYQEISTASALPYQQKTEWLKTQFNAIRVNWDQGHIKIKIRRSHILSDSMEAVESIQPTDMHKIFRFEFIGEPGLDAGGLAREWYQLVAEQLFNPDFGLFLYSSLNQMCMQINPNSDIANELHLKYFHFAGRFLGKALMDGQLPQTHLIQPLYKHIMGWPVMLQDLEHIDDEVYRNLMTLLDMDDADIASLYLDFTVSEDRLGASHTVELCEKGSDVTVTSQNLAEYLQAQLRYRVMDRIKPQLLQFLRGFYDVVPEPFLAILDYQELELVLHGLPVIDMEDWMSNTLYSGDFTSETNHKVINWFWDIVKGYDLEKKAKLLQFATGTCGVPSQGFGYLQGNDGNIRKFTLHGDKNLKVFPRSHTCFNRLDMPIYSSKNELQKYLTMAISLETQGFDIE